MSLKGSVSLQQGWKLINHFAECGDDSAVFCLSRLWFLKSDHCCKYSRLRPCGFVVRCFSALFLEGHGRSTAKLGVGWSSAGRSISALVKKVLPAPFSLCLDSAEEVATSIILWHVRQHTSDNLENSTRSADMWFSVIARNSFACAHQQQEKSG